MSYFVDNEEFLSKFIVKLENSVDELILKDKVVKIIKIIIARNTSGFDSFDICTFNIENRGNSFIDIINKDFLSEHWNLIIFDLLRFCKEFELKSNSYIEDVYQFLMLYNSKQFEYDEVYYIFNKMPYDILNHQYREKTDNLKSEIVSSIDKVIENELPNKKEAIELLKNDCNSYVNLLKGFKQEFSFLALNQAFNKLEKSKKNARLIVLIFLFLLGSLIVYIPYFYYEKSFLIEQMTKIFNLSLNKSDDAMPLFILFSGLIPMVFIESIFIYYFKIVLNKYNSLADQIVQLETKQAIMQFIESYVDYKKNKGLTNEELSKFEDIIFSQISPNLKDVPTSPDLVSIIDVISKATRKK